MKGHTSWRNQGNKKNLSESTLEELYALDVPDGFIHALSELDIDEILGEVKEEALALSEGEFAAEVFLGGYPSEEKDGLFWKVIAKEGKWKYSPGPGQKPIEKPLTFVSNGKSDKDKLVVSIEELKQNFDSNAKQYVTVPLTHQDRVEENTGFIKEMIIDKDEYGCTLLKAGIEFTEPDIREKIKRGSIVDISSGIHFDYVKKDDGSRYNAIVDHAALTNHPWLNGMTKFQFSDEVEILAFSEEMSEDDLSAESSQLPQGGENVEVLEENKEQEEVKFEAPAAPMFLSELGISEDEAKARLAEYASLKAEQKLSKIDERCRKWQEEGVPPALVLAAKSILEADEGAGMLSLSENGKDGALTASDIVDRLIEATPHVNLAEDKVTDKDVEGQAPPTDATSENALAGLTLAERGLAATLMFDAAMSQEEAITEAKNRLATK